MHAIEYIACIYYKILFSVPKEAKLPKHVT